MPSLVWSRDPEEAFDNPYEYGAQKQFSREASRLLNIFHDLLDQKAMHFHRNDKSVAKAIWMLHLDALEGLRDCLKMLKSENHKIAGRLFRDISETLDLAAYFRSQTPQSNSDLEKWYKDEIIPHRKYRDYVSDVVGKSAAEAKRNSYRILSKFTHRTYRILLEGYTLGRGEMLVHDTYRNTKLLVPPQTISAYFAVLSGLITRFSDELVQGDLAIEKQIDGAWKSSLETITVRRRFAVRMPKAQSAK